MNKIKIIIRDFIINNYFSFLVLAVIVFAFILRCLHAKTGLPYLYNWDEPHIASTALRMMKTGDLNPHFFKYGSMMIYSNFIVDILHYLSLMGHPATADSYLTNINEIIINANTGWQWTISHPSFYYWNRMLTVLLGTGTVFFTYLMGGYVFNKWIGLIAAVFLATLPFHIVQSAWITTDAPVAFFVLAVVLFSMLFIKYKKPSYFILSLVFVGVSIATKYNAALSIIAPLSALVVVYVQTRKSIKTYMWFLVPIIPVIIFFLIMPYAIIDLTTFLKDVGYEVHHYKILGHGGATSIPGWEHFCFQMHQFYRNIGLVNTILIGIGIVAIFFRPFLIFTLILPVIYIVYMTGMKVNFHRNFVQVYPFIALLFAAGIYIIYYILNIIQKRMLPKKEWLTIMLIVFISFGFMFPQAYSSVNDAKIKYETKDTRSRVIDEINALKDAYKVVVAQELMIHSQDLKHLKKPYTVVPLLKISTQKLNKNTLLVLPSNPKAWLKKVKFQKKAERMRKFISEVDKLSIVKRVGDNGATMIDIYSVNPGIMLVKP